MLRLFIFALSECRHGTAPSKFGNLFSTSSKYHVDEIKPTKLFDASKMECLFQSIIEIISIRILGLCIFFSFSPFKSGIEQSNCIEYRQ